MGLLGGAAVLLYSVDQKTRLQGGKQRLVRRMRPPRVFEPQLPQLRTLEESMVLTLTLTPTLTLTLAPTLTPTLTPIPTPNPNPNPDSTPN